MPSNIDPTKFPDNQPVAKSDLRLEFQIAHDEISKLQSMERITRKMMVDDNLWNTA